MLPRILSIALVLGFLGFASSQQLEAASWMDRFKDPEDGKLDLSLFLTSKTGFLPVPIVITEPAIGPGFGFAPVFFHKSLAEIMKEAENEGSGRVVPPSISTGFGFYTENETWMVGGAHVGFWKNDRIRYIGGFGAGEFNLEFFGIGDDPVLGDEPLNYNLEVFGLLQDLRFRIGESNVFIGGRYLLIDTFSTFEIGDVPEIPTVELDSRTAGLNLIVAFDNRDNTITPSRGWDAKALGGFYDEWLGGDFRYQRLEASVIRYQPVGEKLVIGSRLGGIFTDGETPFYHLSTISMRGIQAGQYTAKHAIQLEAELRWKVANRWRLVAFGGVGRQALSLDELSDASNVGAYGAGFRYVLARLLKLESGLDFAWDEDGNASFYVTAGSAWR